MRYEDVLEKLESFSDREAAAGMARFGIKGKEVLGVSMPELRKLGKEIGKDHALALRLWERDMRETRILAGIVEEPGKVTEEQAEKWALDFDSWEVCDQCCMNLLWLAPFAWKLPYRWSRRKEEFVRRAAFAMMAVLAWKDKEAPDTDFGKLLPLIRKGATDERPMVKKAVNWALRQIGKRNARLNGLAIAEAGTISGMGSPAARWIAADALRELRSDAVRKRLKKEG